MDKSISLALLVGGVVLMIYGVSASDSLGSDFNRFFTGSPITKGMWLLLGGAVASAVGLSVLFLGSKSR